jgi:hypothetical protein
MRSQQLVDVIDLALTISPAARLPHGSHPA